MSTFSYSRQLGSIGLNTSFFLFLARSSYEDYYFSVEGKVFKVVYNSSSKEVTKIVNGKIFKKGNYLTFKLSNNMVINLKEIIISKFKPTDSPDIGSLEIAARRFLLKSEVLNGISSLFGIPASYVKNVSNNPSLIDKIDANKIEYFVNTGNKTLFQVIYDNNMYVSEILVVNSKHTTRGGVKSEPFYIIQSKTGGSYKMNYLEITSTI